MNYVEINNIRDVLPHIEGYDEIVVAKKEWYTVIDYVTVTPKTFDGPGAEYRLECRGLKFCNRTGNLLARPFHKFFNINERPDTLYGFLDFSKPHRVMEKMDGTMVHGIRAPNGDIRLMTRMGLTQHALQAEQYLTEYLRRTVIEAYIEDGMTPIFEFTAPNNRIVVPYDKPELTLLGVRDMQFGDYAFSCMDFERSIGNVRTVQEHKFDTPDQMIEQVREWTGKEGVVVAWNNKFVKLKADEYVLLHRAKSELDHEKNVVRVILEGRLDDLVPLLDAETAAKIEKYHEELIGAVVSKAQQVKDLVREAKARDFDVKDFAINIAHELPAKTQALAFGLFRGKYEEHETVDKVIEAILSSCGTQKAVDYMRSEGFLGANKWFQY